MSIVGSRWPYYTYRSPYRSSLLYSHITDPDTIFVPSYLDLIEAEIRIKDFAEFQFREKSYYLGISPSARSRAPVHINTAKMMAIWRSSRLDPMCPGVYFTLGYRKKIVAYDSYWNPRCIAFSLRTLYNLLSNLFELSGSEDWNTTVHIRWFVQFKLLQDYVLLRNCIRPRWVHIVSFIWPNLYCVKLLCLDLNECIFKTELSFIMH